MLVAAGLAFWAAVRTDRTAQSLVIYQHEPAAIMGTRCKLVVVADRDQVALANQSLLAAEAELRRFEGILSTWIDLSPVSRLNSTDADTPVEIPAELEQVLRLSADLYDQTSGTFDITVKPVIELWRQATQEDRSPSAIRIAEARDASSWHLLSIGVGTAVKSLASVRVDIDGVAKGFAIDRVAEDLAGSGFEGGMVEVGGDLRVFGAGPGGAPWTVAIRSPFDEQAWAEIELVEGAVCSSGDYARFLEIEGRRYSHIIDPRTGVPAADTHAVTVVGPDAATADAWATALSVLGPEGLAELAGTDLEALIVTGEPENYRLHATAGFRELLVRSAFDLAETGQRP